MNYPRHLPNREYSTFAAAGFDRPVTGVIYNDASDQQGLPLGGLGTGWIGLGLDGTLDYYSTLFNHFLERRYLAVSQCSVPEENPDHWIQRKHIPRHRQPFLALTINGLIQPLTTRWVMNDNKPACPQIDYWGHYPVADLQYELRDSTMEASLRAWTPFLPGDAEGSNTPGSVFELRLRNHSNETKKGHAFFAFHGPREAEVRGKIEFRRRPLQGSLSGVEVSGENGEFLYSYALGAIGEPAITGGEVHLCRKQSDEQWYTEFNLSDEQKRQTRTEENTLLGPNLPVPAPDHAGTTVGVAYELAPGQEKVIRFVLAWYAPRWRTQVRQPWVDGGYVHQGREFFGHSTMIHQYAGRFTSAADVASYLAQNHESLLRRILAWQREIYAESNLPGWLQDALVNVFAILPHVSFWMKNADPEHWTNRSAAGQCPIESQGIFCCVENMLTCPQQGCLANDEWGEWTVNLFFPALARNKLRLYQHDQQPNGNLPSTLGFGTEPHGHWYDQQPPVDGQAWIQIVDRVWQVTGDDTVLDQFFGTLVRNLEFLKTIDADGDGILDVNGSNQYYDTWPTMAGASSHIGTYWLSTLRIVERMAENRHDPAVLADVRHWYARAARSLEEKVWNADAKSYLVYHKPEAGLKSDSILADQILGQFFAEMHGLEDLFPEERIRTVLETIWTHNVKAARFGIRTSIRADLSNDGTTHHSGMQTPSYSSMVPACLMIRHDMKDRGLHIMESTWRQIVCTGGMAWDQPCMLMPDGSFGFGIEYYHNTMLWVVPMALMGDNLQTFTHGNGLAARVVRAAGKGE